MKKWGIFKNDTFIFKKVPRGSKKFTAGKSCKNQISRHSNTIKNSFYVYFCYKPFFWATGYVFEYKSVAFEDIPLFDVWGTIIDPNLRWKGKFGPVNLLFWKLLNNWLQNNPNQWKNHKIWKFWPLGFKFQLVRGSFLLK